jgi:hypothetical protein
MRHCEEQFAVSRPMMSSEMFGTLTGTSRVARMK